jgi:hypothetical protein
MRVAVTVLAQLLRLVSDNRSFSELDAHAILTAAAGETIVALSDGHQSHDAARGVISYHSSHS